MRFSRDAVLTWLGAVVAVTATVRLGMWQLDRAAQKSAWVHDQAQRAQLPALTQADLARTPELAMAQWFRQITVSGTWLPQLTLFLDNQPLDGRAGFVAVTPLLIAPGDAVLVQRGWAPRDPADRTRVSLPPSAAGVVSVAARVAPLPSKRFELGGADDGPIRQNLDAAELARDNGASNCGRCRCSNCSRRRLTMAGFANGLRRLKTSASIMATPSSGLRSPR